MSFGPRRIRCPSSNKFHLEITLSQLFTEILSVILAISNQKFSMLNSGNSIIVSFCFSALYLSRYENRKE